MFRGRKLLLFDVDGTLTPPMRTIPDDLRDFLLHQVRPHATLGLVGGSDYAKISKQMGGQEIVNQFDYVFSENGVVHHQKGNLVSSQSMVEFIGEDLMQTFINFCLKYMSDITLPAKRGNFIEFRTGMLNVSPIGRSCSQRERDQFVEYESRTRIRQKFVKAMQEAFPDSGLQFSIGGQISIDVFPVGWDKTFCLRHVEGKFDEIYFFGDKTDPGGNDHEIYIDGRTIGYNVTSPEDTKATLMKVIMALKYELDPTSGFSLYLYRYKNVKNIKNLLKEAKEGTLKCALLNPKVIYDPFQVVIAANKAILSLKNNSMITRSVYSEIIFNLSPSKNIMKSLSTFGIDASGDLPEDIIVATVQEGDEDKGILESIDGELCPAAELSDLRNIECINKTYNIKGNNVIRNIVTICATK